jgi:hypothetical protein
MKRVLITAGLSVLLAASAFAQAKPDFSGTWNLDLTKSDFGPTPPPDSMVLVVEHKEPALKIMSTQTSQGASISNTRNITTDGKPNANKLQTGDGAQDVTSTSKWNGNKLSTAYTLEMQGMKLGVNDSWSLSADGKVLTVMRAISTEQGDLALTTVFNKK